MGKTLEEINEIPADTSICALFPLLTKGEPFSIGGYDSEKQAKEFESYFNDTLVPAFEDVFPTLNNYTLSIEETGKNEYSIKFHMRQNGHKKAAES